MNEKKDSDEEILKLDLDSSKGKMLYFSPPEIRNKVMKSEEEKNKKNDLNFINKLIWRDSKR